MAVTSNELENAARIVYRAMTLALNPYQRTPQWQNGGNSDMQTLARETAERIISGLVLELVPPEWCVVQGRAALYRCVDGVLQYKALPVHSTLDVVWAIASHVPIHDFDLVAELRQTPRAPVKTLVEQAMEQLGKAGYLIHAQYVMADDGIVSQRGADSLVTKPVYVITKEPQQ